MAKHSSMQALADALEAEGYPVVIPEKGVSYILVTLKKA